MRLIALERPDDPETFYQHAAALLAEGVAPEAVSWTVGEAADLFASAEPAPRAVWRGEKLFGAALLHRAPQRHGLVYRALWRAAGDSRWLTNPADPDLCALRKLEGEVRRDMHKMRAFVRFREVRPDDGAPRFVAWFEPGHYTLRANADFFARRFANVNWSIVTPDLSAHCDGGKVTFAPGGARRDAPADDARDEDWLVYYASTFNPARLNLAAMQKEMPRKYWRNLPEARAIAKLAGAAQSRANTMIAAPPTRARVSRTSPAAPPPAASAPGDLAALRAQLAGCQRCPLHCNATQTVCGAGPDRARLMIVAEQPGDQEDIAGAPLVGPAGRVFDEALRRVDCDRDAVYVTNAVKHFKFTLRGKRRIHAKPSAAEIDTCSWWLHREVELVQPRIIVAMGASALRGLTGRTVAVRQARGDLMNLPQGPQLLTTTHPAYLLRLRDQEEKRLAWRAFVGDLERAKILSDQSS